jgi:hypothetical protein
MGAGGEGAFVQLLISWAHHQTDAILKTHVLRQKPDGQIEKLARSLNGLVAVYLAKHVLDLRQEDITGAIRTSCSAYLNLLTKAIELDEIRTGPEVNILCVDHINKGRPLLLYKALIDGSYQPRDRDEFTPLAQEILDVTIGTTFRPAWSAIAAAPIGGMIYELFKNTHDHALYTVEGDQLKNSVRGVQARLQALDQSTLPKLTSGYRPLERFLTRLVPDPGLQTSYILEISVFDSGPGFAQTMTGKKLKDLSTGDELDAIKKCFTIASSKSISGAGQGLPHVSRLLTNAKGFLRLRTGRHSLYCDFDQSEVEQPISSLLRTYTAADNDELPEVTGSLVTIFIPMSRHL